MEIIDNKIIDDNTDKSTVHDGATNPFLNFFERLPRTEDYGILCRALVG